MKNTAVVILFAALAACAAATDCEYYCRNYACGSTQCIETCETVCDACDAICDDTVSFYFRFYYATLDSTCECGLTYGAVAGICIAGVVALVLFGVAACLYRRRRRRAHVVYTSVPAAPAPGPYYQKTTTYSTTY